MAWLETDRHGRLRIGFKYYDGRIYREPLGVEANKRTRADGERLSARFNSNCRPAFSTMRNVSPTANALRRWASSEPSSDQTKRLENSWRRLGCRRSAWKVKRSTFVYYNEIYKPHIENAEIGKKFVSEIADEDINLWKLEIDAKRTPNKGPLSTRRKNMSLMFSARSCV